MVAMNAPGDNGAEYTIDGYPVSESYGIECGNRLFVGLDVIAALGPDSAAKLMDIIIHHGIVMCGPGSVHLDWPEIERRWHEYKGRTP
jgi:hypothetical protein